MSSRTPITRSLLLLVLLLLVAVTWAQNGHNIATINEYYDALGDEDVDDDEDMDGDYTITGVDDLEAVVAEAETTHDPMSLPTCLLCVCLRGSVYCDDNKLTKIPSLPRDTSYFYARYNAITSVEKKDFEGLDKLRRVNLSNNRIKSVDPGTFDGLPVLEELLISNNDLTELPGLPISLVTLAANWNSIIDSGLPSDGLAKMENLKDLYLGNNQLEHVPHGLPENLQLLHLQHNKIDSIANDTFCKPGDKTYVRKSLQDVRLDNNPVLLGSAPDAYICLRRLPTGQF